MSGEKESTKSVAEITSHDVYPYAGPTDDRSLRHLYSGPNGERHQKVKVLQGGGDSGVMGYVGSPCDISNESSSSLDYIFRGSRPTYQRRHERVGEVGFNLAALQKLAAQKQQAESK
ncbi:uncharacterized protein LOC134854402 [Symsagittifera roscoffensis]|uniref:uncharacterized protein LOC134854402 n=1 Tax=Symsagittifera roscoffensis TaxID=84072 RepID=UPI00307C746B